MPFYFKILKSRIKGILFSPVKTWEIIKKELGYTIESTTFIFACCIVMGIFSFSRNTTGWIAEIFIPFFTILISSVFIRFLKEVRKINWESSFNLIVYSYFPLLLLYVLSFIGFREFLIPLGAIYSIILLFIAVKNMFNLKIVQSLILTVEIALIVCLCLFALMVVLSV